MDIHAARTAVYSFHSSPPAAGRRTLRKKLVFPYRASHPAAELGRRSIEAGDYLQARLTAALRDFEMVKEVRGMGLLMGIEFRAPSQLRLRIPYQAFGAVHPAMFGQIVVMRLFRDSGFLTQICGNNFSVLKVAPPLVVTDAQLDAFVLAIRDVVELAHSPGAFWSEALGLARRAFRG